MRGIKTDLALGLEIKKLAYEKTGDGILMAPRALLNAALLPFFAAGVLASDGRFDLGGWMLPAERTEYNIEVDVNFLSLKGGGLIFRKTYHAGLVDSAVSDRISGKSDRPGASRLMEILFTRICRDHELDRLIPYVEVAWIGRLLAEKRLDPKIKADLVTELASKITLPTLTEAEIQALQTARTRSSDRSRAAGFQNAGVTSPPSVNIPKSYDIDPDWLAIETARTRMIERIMRIELSVLGDLFRPAGIPLPARTGKRTGKENHDRTRAVEPTPCRQ